MLYRTFPPLEILLIAALALAGLWQIYFYVRYMLGFWRLKRREKHGRIVYADEQPGVSVIICARDRADDLRVFLPHVLEQDYPEFEVIVVDNGSLDDTTDVLNIYQQRYPHLRTTFVPNQARLRSPRKLAITLGVKAARYDHLVFTSPECCPENRHWLSHMVRNFVPGVDFVIGYNAFYEQHGLLNRLICYDNITGSIKYMGAAFEGKPYMGVGSNMAYRKEFFMQHRGFADFLGMRWGEDLLYINRYATKDNIRVEANPESVMWSAAPKKWSDRMSQKVHELSAMSQYTSKSFLWIMLEPTVRFLFYALLLAALIIGITRANYLLVALSVILYTLRIIGLIWIMAKASRRYGTHVFGLRIAFFDLFLPFVTTWLMLFRTGKVQRRDFF